MRMTGPLLAATLCAAIPAAAAELANDSFTGTGTPAFQAGFVAGEIGASRFVPAAGTWKVTNIRLLFGPGGNTQQVKFHVWDDGAGASAPGTALMTPMTLTMWPDTTFLQDVDISTENVLVSGPFRVGVEFTHSGYPGIARDEDGIKSGRNFIKADGLGWVDAALLGVTGDWIIRAEVAFVGALPDAGEPPDAGELPDAGALPDAGVEPDAGTQDAGPRPDAGATAGCRLNSDCPGGQFCNANGACDFQCRADLDCATGQICSTLGQCVAPEEETSGCGCGASPSGVVLAAMLGLLGLRRRRARRR